jgi:PAS domain-containing protein
VRDVQVLVLRAEGGRRLLSVNYQPTRDETGAISGLVLSFRDVTEREAEHRRLAESEDRLREAHEVARLASWELDPDTEEVVIFHALAQDDSDAGATVPLDQLLEPMLLGDREVVRNDLAAMVAGERDDAVSYSQRDYPSGSVWLETRSRAVRDAGGRLLCIRGTSQDVTEREVARQGAERSRDEAYTQAALLDEVDVAVIATDPEGLITHWNHGAERLYGWTDAEAL